MSKFKPGDEVVCVDATYCFGLVHNGTYKIAASNKDPYVELVGLEEDNLFFSSRFELLRKDAAPAEAVPAITIKTTLPIDSATRKNFPIFSGVLRYFPAALAGIANTSKRGNDKHNPGEEMHHARGKSTDQGDCILRHLIDVEDLMAAYKRGDKSITPESILIEVNQMAWRALALSQEIHEQLGAPLAPGAKDDKNSAK